MSHEEAAPGVTPEPVDLLLAAAVTTELYPFARPLGIGEPFPETARARHHGREIALLAAGMGRAGDATFAGALSKLRPAAVINVGIAGALDTALQPGAIVVVSDWRAPLQPHETLARADDDLRAEIGRSLDAGGVRWATAPAVTVNSALHDPGERDALRSATGAGLVEMEGAEWASRAAEAGVPFAALRVVSDQADRPLPGTKKAVGKRSWMLNDDGTARRGRVFWALATSRAWLRPRHHLRQLSAAGIDWASALASLEAAADALLAHVPGKKR